MLKERNLPEVVSGLEPRVGLEPRQVVALPGPLAAHTLSTGLLAAENGARELSQHGCTPGLSPDCKEHLRRADRAGGWLLPPTLVCLLQRARGPARALSSCRIRMDFSKLPIDLLLQRRSVATISSSQTLLSYMLEYLPA